MGKNNIEKWWNYVDYEENDRERRERTRWRKKRMIQNKTVTNGIAAIMIYAIYNWAVKLNEWKTCCKLNFSHYSKRKRISFFVNPILQHLVILKRIEERIKLKVFIQNYHSIIKRSLQTKKSYILTCSIMFHFRTFHHHLHKIGLQSSTENGKNGNQ